MPGRICLPGLPGFPNLNSNNNFPEKVSLLQVYDRLYFLCRIHTKHYGQLTSEMLTVALCLLIILPNRLFFR